MAGRVAAPPGDGGTADPSVPEGLVPVVVALGPGGRTAVSCNRGRNFRVNDFHQTPDADHSPNAATGLAGGKGAVIASAGWGAPGRIFYSDNAVDWRELPSSSYTEASGRAGPSTQSTSNAFFDGEVFKVFWSSRVWASPDGIAWKETAFQPSEISNIRDVEFYPDHKLLVMRTEIDDSSGRRQFVMTSTDLGKTYKLWSPGSTGCDAFGFGPVAQSHGVIIAGGIEGGVCRSQDGGATWSDVPNIRNVSAMFADRAALFIARGDELLRSEDGNTWTRVLKANATLAAGTWSTATGYVVSADTGGQLKFFRSDDGKSWVSSAAVTGTSFIPRFMRTAFVKPSPKCPSM